MFIYIYLHAHLDRSIDTHTLMLCKNVFYVMCMCAPNTPCRQISSQFEDPENPWKPCNWKPIETHGKPMENPIAVNIVGQNPIFLVVKTMLTLHSLVSGYLVKSVTFDFADLPLWKRRRLPNLLEWLDPNWRSAVARWLEEEVTPATQPRRWLVDVGRVSLKFSGDFLDWYWLVWVFWRIKRKEIPSNGFLLDGMGCVGLVGLLFFFPLCTVWQMGVPKKRICWKMIMFG